MKPGLLGQVLTEAVYPPLLLATVAAGVLTLGGWLAGRLVDQLEPTVRVLLWAVPLTFLGAIIAVDLAYATFTVCRGNRDIAAYGIRYAGWETTNWRFSRDKRKPGLTRLAFASSRDLPLEGDSSSQVVPQVSFYAIPRRELVFEARGRWTDSGHGQRSGDAGEVRSPGSSVHTGMSLPLDIVAKCTEDDYCYALDGDHADRPAIDWMAEERKLKPGLYGVRVRLLGRRSSEAFWFLLVNLGRGEQVQIVDYDARHGETPAGFRPG